MTKKTDLLSGPPLGMKNECEGSVDEIRDTEPGSERFVIDETIGSVSEGVWKAMSAMNCLRGRFKEYVEGSVRKSF